MTQLAFLSGYDAQNIVKGETHGMAQVGGPVISTFFLWRRALQQVSPSAALWAANCSPFKEGRKLI